MLSMLALLASASPLAASQLPTATLDRTKLGDKFWGLGGLSGGGATSRLLIDYVEPQRSQLLDILFKPQFGASLQILKVEIGGDSQSTDGTESSHMHSAKDLDYKRGYEWWLLKEAKKRNPEIKTYGLPWAFPGWVGAGTGSPFAADGNFTSDYILKWLQGARNEYGVEIDYIGVWNERASDATYVQTLKKTLADASFPHVQIVAKDGGSDICDTMAADPAYEKAVDIVGLHYPSDFRNYSVCHSLHKPFWASEESSSYDDINGAACWARVVTSHYVLAKITSSIMWNLIGSYYHGTNWYASSMLTAVEPWTGHFSVADEDLAVVYATAHVTQFTKVGWYYLAVGDGSGELQHGGYYVTLVDPAGTDWTMNIVKIDESHAPCTRPKLPDLQVSDEVFTVKLEPSMKVSEPLQVWYSNYEVDPPVIFQQNASLTVGADRTITLPVRRGSMITISTVKTAKKGVAFHPPASKIQFPLPLEENMESVEPSQEAKYWADQIGAFEVHYEDGGSSGNKVLKQMVPALPIGWSDHGSNGPMTLIGMREWQDLALTVKFKLPVSSAAACLATRVDQMWRNGIVLCVDASGAYNLTNSGPLLPTTASAAQALPHASAESTEQQQQQVGEAAASELLGPGRRGRLDVSARLPMGARVSYTSGRTPHPVGAGTWHTLSLTTVATSASATLDGHSLFDEQKIRGLDTGFAALGMNDWYGVEFDDFSVKQAGDRWKPEPSPCGAAKVGAPLGARPCSTNGLPAPDQEWSLQSTWQLKHIPSGLCAEADFQTGAVTLARCTEISSQEGGPQQFFNDYTRIRNAMAPVTAGGRLVGGLVQGGMKLTGSKAGEVTVTDKEWAGVGGWKTWVYFPNTNQLRNQYVANEELGYPMCLSTCAGK